MFEQILIGIGIIVILVLLWRVWVLEQKLRIFWPKGETKALEGLVYEHAEKLQNILQHTGELQGGVDRLRDDFLRTIHKVEMLRFNPFADSGGDQSFTIAMLDGHDNGYIISSFFTQGRPMVYAKPVEAGKSKYKLSGEEEEVLARAMR